MDAAAPTVRIALANLPFPTTGQDAVARAAQAIEEAGAAGAALVAFPEAYVPGYRAPGKPVAPPDPAFLARAWAQLGDACRAAGVTAVVGSERVVDREPRSGLRLTAVVIDRDGLIAGFQDKVQLDPSEDALYAAGAGRRVFRAGDLAFGVAICHEGWRYPETVRWAARRGAQLVVHLQFHEAEPGSYRPTSFADPANTFHEKALLCRAAENQCFVASVNYASDGSPTTSAVVRPDGTLQCYQPYGQAGLLIADLALGQATGLLATRCKLDEYGAG